MESAEGRGTGFHVHWPLATTRPTVPSEVAVPPLLVHQHTVLLLEDEPGVRKAALNCLTRLGCEVYPASNAEEALHLWQLHGPRITLLFADVVIPGEMSGIQLAERLLAERPDLAVILTTGYTLESCSDFTKQYPTASLLPKPYKVAELRKAILQADPHRAKVP